MNLEDFSNFETGTPNMIPGKGEAMINSEKYRIRYYRADVTDLQEISELERILTEGLDGKNIVILEKDKYSFQDRYFVVVTYLEKR